MGGKALKRVQSSPLLVCAVSAVAVIAFSDFLHIWINSPSYGKVLEFDFSLRSDLGDIVYFYSHGIFEDMPLLCAVSTLFSTLIFELSTYVTPAMLFAAVLATKKEFRDAAVVIALVAPFANLLLTFIFYEPTIRYVVILAVPNICVLALALPCLFCKGDTRTAALAGFAVFLTIALILFFACQPPYGYGAGEEYHSRSLYRLLVFAGLCISVACVVLIDKTPSGCSMQSRKLNDFLSTLLPADDARGAAEVPAADESVRQVKPDAFTQLRSLKELLDMGVLTQEEFDAKKKELLRL